MKKYLIAITVGTVLLMVPSMAKDKVTTHQVHFAKETTGSTVKGSVKGYESVLYKLGAKAGQSMRVSIESKKAYFNIYAPGKGLGNEAMFREGYTGNNYVGTLPANGTYTIAVYLYRNEARRGTTAPYTLHIGID